ncbi:pentapeptide repeat-containing protein [Rhodococcus opacus]|uniref:pentapeptide repeat-containing protein n=1 Tax=Rhodococcus opacus TaxID=37919 RepID=UPI00155AF48C|nr:pentapeptide repeat-containing protein [Rhodococcus opacus]
MEPQGPAEEQLLASLRAGIPCNLIDPKSTPTSEEVLKWNDSERMIRAEFLRPLLLRLDLEVKPPLVRLHGAQIVGALELNSTTIDPALHLTYCKIEVANFEKATFTDDVNFDGTTFAATASFNGANFRRGSSFQRVTFKEKTHFFGARFAQTAFFAQATFLKTAAFDSTLFGVDAWFKGTSFAGQASLNGVMCMGGAYFQESHFSLRAVFSRATFLGRVAFHEATFVDRAGFIGAVFASATGFEATTFTKDAQFADAMFTRNVRFAGAIFTEDALFERAVFTGEVQFDKATFTKATQFDGVHALKLTFRGAEFHSFDLGPLHAQHLNLNEAVFHNRIRLTANCSTLTMQHIQIRSAGHLQIHAARIAADGAEFIGSTVLSDPGYTKVAPPQTQLPPDSNVLPREEFRARQEASGKAAWLNDLQLGLKDRMTTLLSLRTANVGELVLSSVVLNDCRFAGAHGLDKLRIDATCSLSSSRSRRRWSRPVRSTQRLILAEELHWRRRYSRWDDETTTLEGRKLLPPSAMEIAGIYRDLRKGLEDAKNEPGAADFYYGEMEMRRLSRRTRDANHERVTSMAERLLLEAYWAVSGYGLRASRAAFAIVLLILSSAMVFDLWGTRTGTGSKAESIDLATGVINYPPQLPSEHGFGDALVLALRNSLSLLRNPTTPAPALTPVGELADITLRLLTPVLLGFLILALRGRTKR